MKDPIVEEVQKHRREILESFDGDIRAMMKASMKKQHMRGHKVVSPKRKTEQVNEPKTPYPKNLE